MTVPYAEVIGDPVSHSKSPVIHRFWLERLGITGDYRAERVSSDGLAGYFAARRDDPDWRGCNVTMPLKEKVLDHLVSVDESAARIGAVNLVTSRRQGFNSDALAVARLLAGHHAPAKLRIIGTGGAARAALQGALDAGFAKDGVSVHGRNAGKARQLAGDFLGDSGCHGDLSPQSLAGASILINASPLGMRGFPALDIAPEGLVFDMVYDPLETALLAAARARGLPTIDGLDMLIEQAAEAFALFFGHAPPREHDAALRERLAA